MKLAEPRTLGLVLVAWGVIGFCAVAGIVALLSAPWFEGDAWQLPTLTSPLGLFALFGVLGAALSLVAGVGLRRATRWSRPLGYIASTTALATVPIGTLVGVYGLIVLLGNRRPAA